MYLGKTGCWQVKNYTCLGSSVKGKPMKEITIFNGPLSILTEFCFASNAIFKVWDNFLELQSQYFYISD